MTFKLKLSILALILLSPMQLIVAEKLPDQIKAYEILDAYPKPKPPQIKVSEYYVFPVGTVFPNKPYKVIEGKTGYYQIKLEDGSIGWVNASSKHHKAIRTNRQKTYLKVVGPREIPVRKKPIWNSLVIAKIWPDTKYPILDHKYTHLKVNLSFGDTGWIYCGGPKNRKMKFIYKAPINTVNPLVDLDIPSVLPAKVVHLSFDNEQIKDKSTYHHEVSLVKGVIDYGKGINQTALKFLDTIYKINDAPDLKFFDKLTVSTWIKAITYENSPQFIKQGIKRGWVLDTYKGQPTVRMNIDGTWFKARGIKRLKPGRWYQLTATYNGEWIKLFVNGDLIAETRAKGQLSSSKRTIYLGGFNHDRLFEGKLDEIKLLRKVWTEKHIYMQYHKTRDHSPRLNPAAEGTDS